MRVIINNLDMPRNCLECRLAVQTAVFESEGMTLICGCMKPRFVVFKAPKRWVKENESIYYAGQRPDFCPLEGLEERKENGDLYQNDGKT